MENIATILLSTLCAWVVLFLLTKLMGNQQVSELSMFDYVTGITIGSMAAEMATELETPLYPLIAMVAFALLALAAAVLSVKSATIRHFLKGEPLVLMENGTLYRGSLKRAKLDVGDFLMMCRTAGYFDLSQIQTALFERNGQLSILPRSADRPVTPADLGQAPAEAKVFYGLIFDGEVSEEGLRRCGRDQTWLKKQLDAQQLPPAEQIFLAVYDGQDTLTAYPTVNQVRTGQGL